MIASRGSYNIMNPSDLLFEKKNGDISVYQFYRPSLFYTPATTIIFVFEKKVINPAPPKNGDSLKQGKFSTRAIHHSPRLMVR